MNEEKKKAMIEALAELEHDQWMQWSKDLMEKLQGAGAYDAEAIGNAVVEKYESWKEFWKPYSELPENVKELDREWARKAMAILQKAVGE